MMNGYLLIDKPVGWSSHDCVSVIKKKYSLKKAGHTGTLDPIASGLVIIMLNKACSWFDIFQKGTKSYEVSMLAGIGTDSFDMTGSVTEIKSPDNMFSEDLITDTLNSFKGEVIQTPPKFSALKINGRKAYDYARKGVDVEIKPRTVFINDISLQKIKDYEIFFSVTCSKGFYVRTLCNDIGKKLGIPAVMTSLRRIENSGFSISDAISMSNLPQDISGFVRTEIPEG